MRVYLHQTLIGRRSLDSGRRLSPGDHVFVSVKGFAEDVPGVVLYKSELPFCSGTMFGVELIVGTSSPKDRPLCVY